MRLETQDFVIVSDAQPQDIENFAVGYSAYRYAFRELFIPTGRLRPSQVVLFRRASDFEKRVPKPKDDDTRMLVYSGELDSAALLALAVDGDQEAALSVAYEAETIWGLRRVGYAVPLWASQGAGEVLSSLRMKKGKCLIGAAPSRVGGFPVSWELIPWEHFFDINTGSSEYSGSRATGKFHPQAWGLMHWILLSDGEGRERFRRIAARLGELNAPEVLPLVMGVPLKAMGPTINDHLRRSPARELPFDEQAVRASFRIGPATEAEVKVQLASLLAICGKAAEADRELARAEQLAPEAPYVKEALARRELRENQVAAAAAFYRAAIAAGSKNPMAYLTSARARLNESSMGGTVDYAGGGANNVAAALTDIRAALELDPLSVDAYLLLGRAYYLAPKVADEDLTALDHGLALNPHSIQLRLYRALLCERLGKTEDYLEEILRLSKNPDNGPQFQRQMEDRYSIGKLNQVVATVNELMKEKRFDDALSALDHAQESDATHQQSARYEKVKKTVAEQRDYAHLRDLAKEEKWADLRVEAAAFIKTYPESKAVSIAQTLLSTAEQRDRTSASKAEGARPSATSKPL